MEITYACNICNKELAEDKLAVVLKGEDYEYAVCDGCLIQFGDNIDEREVEGEPLERSSEVEEWGPLEKVGWRHWANKKK
jgi:hypothetical protein